MTLAVTLSGHTMPPVRFDPWKLPPPESDPILSQAFLAAREICSRHAKSFYFASAFLPPGKRYAAYSVYAFCRLLDDAVDEQGEDRSAAEAALTRFEAELDAAYEAKPSEPAGRPPQSQEALALSAFALTVQRCAIPKQYFLDLAAGCRMDLSHHRYDTWQELETYCYRVAGVVGLIMCCVFGVSDPRARRQAIAMGNAMQLTNILRDVGEDADRGRIYLPVEELRRFGIDPERAFPSPQETRWQELMRFEIARARRLFADGAEGLCLLPNDGSRLTAAVMAVVYGGILGAIERNQYDVFSRRVGLSLWQKVARLPAAVKLVKMELGDVPPPGIF